MVESGGIVEVWRKHFEKVSNEEFDWERDSLEAVHAVSGPAEEISAGEVTAAIGKMKAGNLLVRLVLGRSCSQRLVKPGCSGCLICAIR